MTEWAAEFWLTLLLGALIVAVSLSLGVAVGYDRGRQRGIRDERARRAAEAERRYRAGQIKPPPSGHSGGSDAVERCRRKGGCCT